jgi:outer membrane protein assembly factor BamB
MGTILKKLGLIAGAYGLMTLLLGACSGPGASQSATQTPSLASSTSPQAQSPGATPSAAAILPPGDDWPTYHRDVSRTGFDPGAFSEEPPHLLWTSAGLDGDIYAEPLVVGGRVLVATEHNSVYALDADKGGILWQTNLGSPVPRSELACGDIDPSGITSTPVADPASGLLYVVARVEPNHHELFALEINNGAIRSQRAVDPPGSDPRVQQQRGALTLVNARVYVPFGGLYGDCGNYGGFLVAAPLDGTGPLLSYRVSSQRGSGLWAPSGPAADSSGNLYVTSGNGFSGSAFDFGNSVIRLSSDLSLTDWFAPKNWQALNAGDVDLGSMGPSVLRGGLIFQAGKEGVGYLLRADNLGHTGGEVFSAPIAQGAFGGTAFAPPYLFVPCTNGLFALQIQENSSFKLAWSAPDIWAGPLVVAGATVWTVDIGSGSLYEFSATSGQVLFKSSLSRVVHFTTPSVSGGEVFVAAGRQITAFGH